MAKLLVVDPQKDSKVPFLRGMLTRSLQDTGLDFAAAYQLATLIRDDIEDAGEVTTAELRARVTDALREEYPDALPRYGRADLYRENLQVVYSDGHTAPFSRGIHAQRMASCSLPRSKCNAIARMLHGRLIRGKQRQISTPELTALTYRIVVKELGQEHADDYLIWNDFIDNDRQLIVLLGGMPGTGKSTVATELANSLGIVRTQSTDMLREVMRILIPARLSPLLHTSSFKAGGAVDLAELHALKDDDNLLYGFQRQSEMVEVACQAVLQRALNERVSLILEGVHIRPTLLAHIESNDAVIVPFMLCVLDKDSLISRIKGRRVNTRARRAARYLDKIGDIWKLQSALLSEADRADIEIIDNINSETSAREMLKGITQTVAATYSDERIRALRKHFQ